MPGPPGPIGPQGQPGDIILGVSITPTVNRYLYIPPANIDLAFPASIPATEFSDDSGAAVPFFQGLGLGSCSDLYINGILQPGGIYSVCPQALNLNPVGGVINAGKPVILKIVEITAQILP
ncbi:DUF4183 domain-containing protein [Paenibacillus caui]|uniref:DUF4183 domain-containing protein n=1 Tax=Paenibacillus caui TaxID=2873927 RepID=UPI001CA965AA